MHSFTFLVLSKNKNKKISFGKQRCVATRKVFYFSLSLRTFNHGKYLKSSAHAQVALTTGSDTCLDPHMKRCLYSASEKNLNVLKNFWKALSLYLMSIHWAVQKLLYANQWSNRNGEVNRYTLQLFCWVGTKKWMNRKAAVSNSKYWHSWASQVIGSQRGGKYNPVVIYI